MQAAIYGVSGPILTREERDFFADADPAAYILFQRNCLDPDQLRALTADLRGMSGRAELPILIDQEGGRVARMLPPHWPKFPSGWAFANLYDKAPSSAIEAARANARAIALMLRQSGVNVDCLPVLDVRQPEADEIIGDRSLGSDPMRVAALGRAILDGFASAGVVGVVKHIPGHGRAPCDSHKALPVVEASDEELASDVEPFATLNWAPMGMMAHVVYPAWDRKRPASQSPVVIEEIVRKRIGFDGWLMSDDIGMDALEGGFGERASRVVEAGCDVALHCSGEMDEMVAVANAVPQLSEAAEERLRQAMLIAAEPDDGPSFEELVAKRDELLALA